MNNSLTILCLIMLILSFMAVVGSILNAIYDFAVIFIVLCILFAALFGIQLRRSGKK